MQLATRSQRFWANLIDQAISFGVLCALFALMMMRVFSVPEEQLAQSLQSVKRYEGLFLLVYYAIYFAIFYKSLARAQSPGKTLLKLQVVNYKTGEPLPFKWMLIRELIGKSVSLFFFGAGFWAIFWSKENRCWHDQIVETLVVKKTA